MMCLHGDGFKPNQMRIYYPSILVGHEYGPARKQYHKIKIWQDQALV